MPSFVGDDFDDADEGDEPGEDVDDDGWVARRDGLSLGGPAFGGVAVDLVDGRRADEARAGDELDGDEPCAALEVVNVEFDPRSGRRLEDGAGSSDCCTARSLRFVEAAAIVDDVGVGVRPRPRGVSRALFGVGRDVAVTDDEGRLVEVRFSDGVLTGEGLLVALALGDGRLEDGAVEPTSGDTDLDVSKGSDDAAARREPGVARATASELGVVNTGSLFESAALADVPPSASSVLGTSRASCARADGTPSGAESLLGRADDAADRGAGKEDEASRLPPSRVVSAASGTTMRPGELETA